MTDPLILAYLKTLFYVSGIDESFRIGERVAQMDAIMRNHDHVSWAFITSDNPLSKQLPDSENDRRREHLRQKLNGYVLFDAEGRDPENIWPAEQSYLISGISRTEAVEIGRYFTQRAILTGEMGMPALLVEILDGN